MSVALQMVSGSEMELHIQSLTESPEEGRNKLRASVGGHVRWNSVLREDMEYKQLGK